MSARATFLLNYVAYQLGWLAAIVGAASGHGAAGAALAFALVAGHVALASHRRAEAGLVLAAFITGAVVEGWQIASGTYRLIDAGPVTGVPPWWLLALWAQFATTFRFSLRRVMTRPPWAMLFGAVGGPIAFLAGERLRGRAWGAARAGPRSPRRGVGAGARVAGLADPAAAG